jgi:hypothetical protein
VQQQSNTKDKPRLPDEANPGIDRLKNPTPPRKPTSSPSNARDPNTVYSYVSPEYIAAKKRLAKAAKARQSGLKKGNPYYETGRFNGSLLDADKLLVIRVESAVLGVDPEITEAGINKARIKGGGIRDGVAETFTESVLKIQKSDALVGNPPDNQRQQDIINALKKTRSGGGIEKDLIKKLQGQGLNNTGLPNYTNPDGSQPTPDERLKKAAGVAQAGGDIYNANDYAAYDTLEQALKGAGITDAQRNAAFDVFKNSVAANEAAASGTGTGTGGSNPDGGTGSATGDGTKIPVNPGAEQGSGNGTNPEPTPTNPEPTPTNPEPAPTNPEPAPTNPEPAPTNPEPAPTNPEPAPTNPKPAPTNPEPAPDTPASTDPDANNSSDDNSDINQVRSTDVYVDIETSESSSQTILWRRDNADGTSTYYTTDLERKNPKTVGTFKSNPPIEDGENATVSSGSENAAGNGDGEESSEGESSDDESSDDESSDDESSDDENKDGDEDEESDSGDSDSGDSDSGDSDSGDSDSGDSDSGDSDSGDKDSEDGGDSKPVNPNYDDGIELNKKTDLEIWQERQDAKSGIKSTGPDSDLGAGKALERKQSDIPPRRTGPNIDYEDQPAGQTGTYLNPLSDNNPQSSDGLAQKAIDAAKAKSE